MTITASVRRLARLFCCLILALLPVLAAPAAALDTTTVADTVYRADGTPAGGTLVISWPAFSTADGEAVPAGRMTVKIGAAGAVSIPLAPNFGASPEGTYYTVVYKLDDGTTSQEFWSVPAASTTTIAAIRSKLVPANVAVQYATRQYVDSMLAGGGGGGGSGNAVKIQGVDVDAASPVRGQSLTFDGTRYIPQSHGIVDAVRDCGLKADGVSDDAAAFAACWAANLGREIYLPNTGHKYIFNSTINAPANAYGTWIHGENAPYGALSATTIQFPKGINPGFNLSPGGADHCIGCKFSSLVVDGGDPKWSLAGASQCVLPSLSGLVETYGGSATPTSTNTSDGFRGGMAFARFENITVQNFGRVGIRATGNASNSDFMFMKDVQLRGNAIGFYENGTDTSASGFHNVNPYGNMMAGLIERSFLGNTWVNPFGEFNGEDPPLPGTANTSNLARSGNVVTATLATALPSDTAGVPGVGNAIVIAGTASAGTSFNGTFFIATISADRKTITWAQTGANESASGQGTARTGICSEAMAAAGWTPHGLSFVPAGAAVNTTIIGGYDEGAKTQFGPYALVFGGNYGNVDWSDSSVRPSVFITGGPNNGISLPMRFRDVDLSGNAVRFFVKLGGECLNHADNSLFCLVDTTQIANPNGYVSFKMKTIAGNISNWYGYQIGQSEFDYNDSLRIPNYNTLNPITGDGTNMGWQAGAWFPNGFYFGNTSIANRQGVSELGNSRITPAWSSGKGSLITSNLNIAAGGFGCWMNAGSTNWYASCPVAKDSTGTQWQFPQVIIGTSQALTGTSGAGSTVIVNNADINASGQVAAGAISEAKQTLADNATWNASTSAHGYLKKLDNNAAHYLDGTGNWSTPSGGSGGSGSFLDWQKALSPITGDGAEHTVYSTAIASIPAGRCVKAEFWWNTTATGSNSKTITGYYGTASLPLMASSTNSIAQSWVSFTVCNDSGVQNAQTLVTGIRFVAGVASAPLTPVTSAIDASTSQVLKVTQNMANTETITPRGWLVTAIQ